MTPAERLERLLGRGAGDGDFANLPMDATPDADAAPDADSAYPSADLVELEAIAKALQCLDLSVSPARNAALRELLEAEAGRMQPPRPDGGRASLGRLPWLGGMGILLLLTMGLWLSRTPKGPEHEEPVPAGGTVAVATVDGEAGAPPVNRVDRQASPPRVTSASVTLPMTTTPESSAAPHGLQHSAVPAVTDRGGVTMPSASTPSPAVGVTTMTGTGSGLGAVATARLVTPAPPLPSDPEASAALPPGRDAFLRGRVTDAAGRPIADAEVTAHRVDRLGIFVQRTGDDGRFSIRLPWGRYQLEARASGFASRWYSKVAAREAAAILIWAADATAPKVHFELPSALSPVTPGG